MDGQTDGRMMTGGCIMSGGVGDGRVSRRAGEQAEGQRDTGLQRWKGGEADKQTEGRRDRGVDEQ